MRNKAKKSASENRRKCFMMVSLSLSGTPMKELKYVV
jgi:hypothetical protein